MNATIVSNVPWKALLLGLALGFLPAATLRADDNDDASSKDKMTAQKFAEKAALGGQKEIALSELAVQKGQDAEVKRFAHRMIRDHSQVNRQLTQIAQTKGITLPPTNAFTRAATSGTFSSSDTRSDATRSETTRSDIDAQSQHERQPQPVGDQDQFQTRAQIPESDLEAFRKLKSASGSSFDRTYMSEMVKDHEKDIQKFEKAAQSLDDDELRKFASDTLPKLREHNRMAEQLAQAIGAKY